MTAEGHLQRDGVGDTLSLLHDASHHLGTPLAIVHGYAQTLQARWDELAEDELRAATAAIARHAARAVDELHALQSRVRASQVSRGATGFGDLVGWLRRMLHEPLEAAGASLTCHPPPATASLDAGVARQALLNVAVAVLGAATAARELELAIAVEADATRFTLTVDRVDGIGADHHHVLGVTAAVVADAGGSYQCSSDARTHVLRLPTLASDEQLGAPICVAVIEDDPDAAALIRTALDSAVDRFEVVADERSLGEGLRAVAATRPHVLLLDQVLPDGLGTDVLDEVHDLSPDTLVVVLSSHERRHWEHSEAPGGAAWLEKGRVLADLGTELAAVLPHDPRATEGFVAG